MTQSPPRDHRTVVHERISQFWSGDLGLTLVTLSLIILIFITIPMAHAGLPARVVFDLVMVVLMLTGAVVVSKSRIGLGMVIGLVLASAIALIAGRLHPTPALHQIGSVFSTITLLVYVRIVLSLMFRGGPVTWSRIQGSIASYLLLGMAWASAYQIVENQQPGAFRFTIPPEGVDEMTAKLFYFSFCTLSTVGYGDVIPLSSFARSLSISEAITGQLFPPILIGALVAMAMRAQSKS